MFEVNREPILMGFAPSNIANDINPGYELPERLSDLAELAITNRMGIELEFEDDLGGIVLPDFPKPAFLGVHQPTSGIDVVDERNRPHSLRQLKDAMAMAEQIGADYFTVHLQTVDRWDDLPIRRAQIETSLKVFSQLAEFHEQTGYEFPVLIENLEYPKYPATLEEIVEVVDYLADDVSIPTGLLLDVGHLWRSRTLINQSGRANPADRVPFMSQLQSTLETVGSDIRAMHLTGCHGQHTHLLPQLDSPPSPGLAEISSVPDYDFRSIGAAVFQFAAKQSQPPYLVNEAFGHPYSDVIQNNHDIYDAFGSDT